MTANSNGAFALAVVASVAVVAAPNVVCAILDWRK